MGRGVEVGRSWKGDLPVLPKPEDQASNKQDEHQYYRDKNQSPGDTVPICVGEHRVCLSLGICVRSPTISTCEHARCIFLVLSNVPPCISLKIRDNPSFLGVWASIILFTLAYAGTHTEEGTSFTASPNLSLNPALPLSNETNDSLTWLSLNFSSVT